MEFTREKGDSTSCKVPIQLPSDFQPDDDEPFTRKRIWIGNIELSTAEYLVLRLAQRFGELEKFDFAYTKAGPNPGKPRGYCFVTYKEASSADRAIEELNGYNLKNKRLVVRHANQRSIDDSKYNLLPSRSRQTLKTDSRSQIAAIEAKLKIMETEGTDKAKHKLRASAPPPPLMRLNIQSSIKNRTEIATKKNDRTYFNSSRTKPY